MKLYDKYFFELKTVINSKLDKAKVTNIHIALRSHAETNDLGLRLLLDQCISEVLGINVKNSTLVNEIEA